MHRVSIWICMFAGTLVIAGPLGKKWESNKNCEACHHDISRAWETSRHYNSHFNKNNLFKKSLEYIAIKQPTRVLDEIKVECAQCHSPRLMKQELSDEEKVGLLLEDSTTKQKFHTLLENKTMENGISCMVCHNIDKIHLNKAKGSEGMKSVTFGPQGIMYGPFADAVSSYHKTEQRQYFIDDSPTLCFVCHYSKKNAHGLEMYATGKEYEQFGKGNEGCKECHMSKRYKGVASNFVPVGEKPKEHMVRKHRFASVDNSNILHNYVDVKGLTQGDKFVIIVKNRSPHKIPTGYGLREIILKVTFLDKYDKVLEKKSRVLGMKWEDKEGEPTIPYLATKISQDTRIDGKSTVLYGFAIPKNAFYAVYSFSYRLISEGLAKKIGITDPFFLREYTFSEQRVHL